MNKIGNKDTKVINKDSTINEVLGAFTVLMCAFLGGKISSFAIGPKSRKENADQESEKWSLKVKGLLN